MEAGLVTLLLTSATPGPLAAALWLQAASGALTITGVDSHGGRAASHAAGEEGHVEGGLDAGVLLAQLVQVCKQREVNDGERHVPGGGKEDEDEQNQREKVSETQQGQSWLRGIQQVPGRRAGSHPSDFSTPEMKTPAHAEVKIF